MRYFKLIFMAIMVTVGIAQANDAKLKERSVQEKSAGDKAGTERAKPGIERTQIEGRKSFE